MMQGSINLKELPKNQNSEVQVALQKSFANPFNHAFSLSLQEFIQGGYKFIEPNSYFSLWNNGRCYLPLKKKKKNFGLLQSIKILHSRNGKAWGKGQASFLTIEISSQIISAIKQESTVCLLSCLLNLRRKTNKMPESLLHCCLSVKLT